MSYIAVVKCGASGEVKYHAADPALMRETMTLPYYVSRCGRDYLRPTVAQLQPFDEIMHLEQCQRCVALIHKEQQS